MSRKRSATRARATCSALDPTSVKRMRAATAGPAHRTAYIVSDNDNATFQMAHRVSQVILPLRWEPQKPQDRVRYLLQDAQPRREYQLGPLGETVSSSGGRSTHRTNLIHLVKVCEDKGIPAPPLAQSLSGIRVLTKKDLGIPAVSIPTGVSPRSPIRYVKGPRVSHPESSSHRRGTSGDGR